MFLTKREQQLISWIRENPSITQQELADRAHISRSSVAVHISNLQHKGAILGRQYILAKKPYVVVVGGANMDIAGKAAGTLTPHDSNPGEVRMLPGGAGRNIAHNLALLENDVKLISAFGEDSRSQEIMESCRSVGIDVGDSFIFPGESAGTYLYVMGNDGEMQMAVADMKIFDKLMPEYLETRRDLIDRSRVCIIDTNLPQESIKYLVETTQVPVFCDPVSTAKAVKLKGLLGKIHTLKPNKLEAEVLSGVTIHDKASLKRAAKVLLDTGLKRVFISLSEKGLYCADRSNAFMLKNLPSNVVNATGAGDAMIAAMAWAYMNDMSLEQTGRAALAASSIVVESPHTINPELKSLEVFYRMGFKRLDDTNNAEQLANPSER